MLKAGIKFYDWPKEFFGIWITGDGEEHDSNREFVLHGFNF